jgi:hypothetical protein
MRCCSILKSSLLKKIGNSADKQTYWGMQGRLRSTERSRAKQTLTTNASRKLRKTLGAKRANAWLLLRFTTHTYTKRCSVCFTTSLFALSQVSFHCYGGVFEQGT